MNWIGIFSGMDALRLWDGELVFWTAKIRNRVGRAAEKKALSFLRGKGLRLVRENYACRLGELDLVMSDKNVLVFVEVRHRTKHHAGSAEESVDNRKQRRLRLAAEHYMQTFGITDTMPCRFDIIAVCPEAGGGMVIRWTENAFGA
ncbi:MAG: YraN family protein [Kistimonas sp.]|nr:YraN family protein [Kistimonas sp.]